MIHKNLITEDKKFLISVRELQPDWSVNDFKRFPSVQWKLQNLKENNSDKYHQQLGSLNHKLSL